MSPQHRNLWGRSTTKPLMVYDRWLLFAAVCLLGFGLLMVASSTVVLAIERHYHALHYLFRQLAYLTLGATLGFICVRIEIRLWEKFSRKLLLLSFILLFLVFIPGIGRSVNGSARWINFGLFTIQGSEFVKLMIIVYLAGYLVRFNEQIRLHYLGFLKPMTIIALITILLLKEPDFGTAVVILMTALVMIYLAGVRLAPFLGLLVVVTCTIGFLAISSPYRIARMTSFLDPWGNQFDSGYQLTQSLIAFGRGGWFGVGLGESIQKLFYLPEAHTDFLFAVIAEELGIIGGSCVILLFCLLITRGFIIGRAAILNNMPFAGYMANGFSLCLGLQTIINIGVNIGVLPTKGLTLPLLSYGGNSLLVSCLMIALILRIDHEVRWQALGLTPKKRTKKI